MKLKKYWWIIVVGIILFMSVGKKEAGVMYSYDTKELCVSEKVRIEGTDAAACVGDCVLFTTSVNDCLPFDYSQKIDSYVLFADFKETCPSSSPYYKCLYSSSCNTNADLNCDSCVSDSEFPLVITYWKKQIAGITDSVFGQAILKWQSQEGCYNG